MRKQLTLKKLSIQRHILWDNIPFLILCTNLLFSLWILSSFPLDYYFDESILVLIARKNVSGILDTVLAEPHPPGFYILLKLLLSSSPIATRLHFVVIAYILFFGAVVYAKMHKIYRKYNLALWYSLLFSSHLFLLLTLHIRHDMLTFPLQVFFFTVYIRAVDKYNERQRLRIVLLVGLTIGVLFFAYIPFLYMYAFMLGATLLVFKRRTAYIGMVVIGGAGAIWYFFYAGTQAMINAKRFTWVDQYTNSLFITLKNQLIGKGEGHGIVSDIVLACLLFLLVYAAILLKRNISQNKFRIIVAMGGLLLIFGYVLNGFVMERYSVVFFMYLLFIIGSGMSYKPAWSNYLKLLVIAFYLISLASYIKGYIYTYAYHVRMAETISSNAENQKLGLLFEDPLYPFLFKQFFLTSNKNVVPVSAYFPNYFTGRHEIRQNDLVIGFAEEWKERYAFLNVNDLKHALAQNNLASYIYVYSYWGGLVDHYDKKRLVLSALNESCNTQEIQDEHSFSTIIFYFNQCKWNEQ